MSAAHEIPRDIDTARLPASLTEIIEVIGLAPALRLVERCGGRKLYVPKKLDPGHPLISALGPEAARRLWLFYKKSLLEIPKQDAWVRAVRDREIRQRHARGVSVQTLAAEYWLTERQIRNICQQPS